jgi:hypothetical protein
MVRAYLTHSANRATWLGPRVRAGDGLVGYRMAGSVACSVERGNRHGEPFARKGRCDLHPAF